MFWILVGIVVALLCYIYLIKPHSYWKSRGVPQTNPVLIFGDSWGPMTRQKSFADMVRDIYAQGGDNRYFGMYQALIPTLMLRDPELIKQLTVKDFDHFQDHRTFIPEDADPLWGKNLFSLTGQRWKDMRSTLSPSFTSSKMRSIFLLISECAESFTKHFLSRSDEELKNLEMKDVFTRFANDVIASVAFGIKCDSLSERENSFYMMGKKATDFSSIITSIKMFAMTMFPKLAAMLKLNLFSSDVSNFFRTIIKKTIQGREEKGIVRNDMIQLLIEARKNGLKYEEQNGHIDTGFATVEESDIGKTTKHTNIKLTDDDITAQGLIFFFAGFDTVSNLMSFMAYELAVNPDIQERLIQEIDETREDCGGKLTYEVLLKMKYLDMVVSESLRKWPIAVAVDRVVTKPYTIQPATPKEVPVHLNLNEIIWLPVFGIHRDPELYPNPERFDPERFNDENKRNINPYTFIPFGSGPRNCIGSRFALLETKTAIFHLLSHFEFAVTEKTPIPLQISRKSFNLTAQNGFWLEFKRRNIVERI